MTNKQILEILKAELTCILKSTTTNDNEHCGELCDNCKYAYLQGTYGERKEMLTSVIKKLEIINEDKLVLIREYIIKNVIQNTDVMFNDEIRNNKMPIDIVELIVDLYEYLHIIITGEEYNYMFHWANKIGADIETGLLDDYINKESETDDK